MIYSGTQWIFFEQKRSRYLAGRRHNLLQPKVMSVYKVTVYKVMYIVYTVYKVMSDKQQQNMLQEERVGIYQDGIFNLNGEKEIQENQYWRTRTQIWKYELRPCGNLGSVVRQIKLELCGCITSHWQGKKKRKRFTLRTFLTCLPT